MGRSGRPYLPGGIFHLTARTLRREALFTPASRTAALGVVARVVPGSGFRLLALAIMPNHLHLVVQQGERPLAALMQPILRRLAHLLQREHRLTGPIFWRPYAARHCPDPDYARNAIMYTHLNPVRAELCADPADYAWTSHAFYSPRAAGVGRRAGAVAVELRKTPEFERLVRILDPGHALPLFATGADYRPQQLRRDYQAWIDWRMEADRSEGRLAPDPPPVPLVSVPGHEADVQVSGALTPLFHEPARTNGGRAEAEARRYAPDLCDIARATLVAEAPNLPLDLVRGRGGGAEHSRIRHLMIRRMHAAGYPNVDIARFLNLSESAVSKVVCARRHLA